MSKSTCAADNSEAVDKVDGPLRLSGDIKGLPPKLIRISLLLLKGIAEERVLQTLEWLVTNGWENPRKGAGGRCGYESAEERIAK